MLGGEVRDDVLDPECERFCFFAGCCISTVEGGERTGRGAPGIAMPSEGSDRDFRRVL